MSKRRFSIQQRRRINQRHVPTDVENLSSDTYEGIVITRFKKQAEVRSSNGQHVRCAIKPSMDDIVTGDYVLYREENDSQGLILYRHPRTSLLARQRLQHSPKAIAANITQLCIVVAQEPALSWLLLDSYLVMSSILKLQAIILLNKADLPCHDLFEELKNIYTPLGYPVLKTSTIEQPISSELNTLLTGEISIIVGQSGVGKSSLIQRLLPDEAAQIATGDLSTYLQQGRHTTTYARYYHLPTEGAIIDSPGVRSFHISDLPIPDLATHFIEFKPFLGQCAFRDCHHIDTPKCAILDALKKNHIHPQRYQNYVKMVQQFQTTSV